MSRARQFCTILFECRMHRMVQHFSHRQGSDDAALRVSYFHAGFAQWRAALDKLPHEIASAVFGFREGVFEMGKLCTFVVTGHAADVAKIDEKPGHRPIQSR